MAQPARPDEATVRKLLERHSKKIGETDATDKEGLRTWISACQHAYKTTRATDQLMLDMVNYLVGGDFATWVDDWIESQPPQNRTWPLLKEAISAQYLDLEEMDYLKTLVERMAQKNSEDVRRFGVRFAAAVQRAYTQQELAVPCITNKLIKAFANGLLDGQVRTQLFVARPQTLQEAFTRAGSLSLAIQLSQQAGTQGRQEEPMEVGAVVQAKHSAPPEVMERLSVLDKRNQDLQQTIKSLQGEIKSWGKKGAQQQQQPHPQNLPQFYPPPQYGQQYVMPPAQMVAPTPVDAQNGGTWRGGRRGRGNRGRGGNRTSWMNGEPVCYTCGMVGHYRRECPQGLVKQAATEAVQAAMQSLGLADQEN